MEQKKTKTAPQTRAQRQVTCLPLPALLMFWSCFLALSGPLTLSQITMALDLPKGSAHRLLATLRGRGYVAFAAQNEPSPETARGSGYVLGPQAALLASRSAIPDLSEAARIPMQSLSREIGEGCQISIRVNREAVCVGRVASPLHPDVALMGGVGARFPLHGVAVGKVLLAFAPAGEQAAYLQNDLPAFTPRTLTNADVLRRELNALKGEGQRAVARDREEYKRGLCALAAPIWDMSGSVCAALGVPYLAGDAGETSRYEAALINAVRAIGQALGFVPEKYKEN